MPGFWKEAGGTRKGKPNKHKAAFREALREYCRDSSVNPHYWMADLLATPDTEILKNAMNEIRKHEPTAFNGPKQRRPEKGIFRPVTILRVKELKFQAAKELAQYLEPKLKSVEVTGDPENPLYMGIEQLTPEQRIARIAELWEKRNGVSIGAPEDEDEAT